MIKSINQQKQDTRRKKKSSENCLYGSNAPTLNLEILTNPLHPIHNLKILTNPLHPIVYIVFGLADNCFLLQHQLARWVQTYNTR